MKRFKKIKSKEMIKTLKKITLIFASVLLMYSCDKDGQNIPQEAESKLEESFDISNEYRLLDYSVNKYHSYFESTDNTIGFNNLKSDFDSEYSLAHTIDLENSGLKSISVNNQKLNIGKNSKSQQISDLDIYGKNLSIDFTSNKSTEDIKSVNLYIPKKLNVSKPVSEDGKSVYAFYKNLSLEWNADPKNENGLMIAVEYFGETVGRTNTGKHLQIIDYIEVDNGKFTLKDKMFEDIPDLSFVDIVLLRGNIDISEVDGETFKTYAEAHQRIPVLLIKDLKSVKYSE
jgi:hypothetical protein